MRQAASRPLPRTLGSMNKLASWVVPVGTAMAGPYLSAYVESHWSLLLVPTLQALGVTARLGTLAVMTLFTVVGALLAAGLLSLPLGLVARSRAWIVGAAVGCVVVVASIVWLHPIALSFYSLVQLVAESLAHVFGCAQFTSLISHQRERHRAT